MLTFNIPNTYFAERKYLIAFFAELLGFEYRLKTHALADYCLKLPNKKQIVFTDSFFSQNKDNYLKINNIPNKIAFAKSPFTAEKDLPIIYGNPNCELTETKINCGIDIFASTFFMLTRWEEHVKTTRDRHGRFPAQASLAYQANFLHRPIVNEYAVLLKNLLKHLGYTQFAEKQRFTIVPSHDVDFFHYPHFQLKTYAGDLLKRFSLPLLLRRMRYEIPYKNHYNTFDFLMKISEKYGVKSRFYFMATGKFKQDNTYRINEQSIVNQIDMILKRGHIVGFHAGYKTTQKAKEWKRQKQELQQQVASPLREGRQHFLRFSVPDTWQIWEDNQMEIVSGMAYAEQSGFRCGTANEFSVFNIISQRQLQLKERPLVAMDVSLKNKNYQNLSPKAALRQLTELKEKCKKYNMPFTILFHNSSFDPVEWKGWKEIYKGIFQ